MFIATDTLDLELAKRSLYRLPAEAQQLTVRAGTLWVTQGNDPRDIILEPGQSFVPDGHDDVVLYALAPASFTVCTASGHHAPAMPARPSRWTRELALE